MNREDTRSLIYLEIMKLYHIVVSFWSLITGGSY